VPSLDKHDEFKFQQRILKIQGCLEQYEEQKSNYDTVLDEQNTSLSFFKNVPFYSLCFDELAEYFRKQISETSKDIKLFTEHGDFFDRIVEDKSRKNKAGNDSHKSIL
jgi:hypothetical protein